LGVVTPLALGWGVGAWMLPDAGPYVHAFLGATLCATSVGITARLLKDLGRSRSGEARVILGAAVVDDVLGLVILAVVTGLIAGAGTGAAFSYWDVLAPLLKASAFLAGALAAGVLLSRRLFFLASKLRARGVLLALGLSFCFLLSWLANVIGLAAIVGAFAAGLVLEDTHYREFVGRGEQGLEELIHPISSFLAPVFFVLMGMHTDLRALLRPEVLGLGGALIVAAVLGKQACALGVVGRGVDRLTVGLGMILREHWSRPSCRRAARHPRRDLLCRHPDGHRHDDDHAARAQVEFLAGARSWPTRGWRLLRTGEIQPRRLA